MFRKVLLCLVYYHNADTYDIAISGILMFNATMTWRITLAVRRQPEEAVSSANSLLSATSQDLFPNTKTPQFSDEGLLQTLREECTLAQLQPLPEFLAK